MSVSAEIRHEQLVVRIAIALILIYCVTGIAVPAGLAWDFANFYDAGHRVAAGQSGDIYQSHSAIQGAPPQGEMRFWSAPLTAAFLSPLSLMAPRVAVVVFKIQNTLAVFAGLGLLFRYGRRFVSPERDWHYAAMLAVMALLFQPFWTVFRVGGQTTPTVFLLLVLGLLAHTRARWTLSALLAILVVMLKPSFIVMVAFLVCVSGVGFLTALSVTGLGVAALSIGLMGWPIHREFLQVLIEGSQTARPWVFNSSLYVPLENFRLLASTDAATGRHLLEIEWAIRAGVVAMFVLIMRRSSQQSWSNAARAHFAFLMAVCFWLLFSSLIWEHYLAVLFLPLAYFAANEVAWSSRARACVAGIVILALGQNLILVQFLSSHLAVASAPALLIAGVLKAGPLILLFLFLALDHAEIFATYRQRVWNDAEKLRPSTGPENAGSRLQAV